MSDKKYCGHLSGTSQHYREFEGVMYCEDCIFKLLQEAAHD